MAGGSPIEACIPGEVALRALCWGELDELASPSTSRSAPSYVLLHGLGDGADIWRPMMAAWPLAGPVIALDLPGHGGSGRLTAGGYGVTELTAIVSAALSRLMVRHPVLIGHSLGAQLALTLVGRGVVDARATILIEMNPDSNDEADAAVADYIDALIGGASSVDDLIGLVSSRLPLSEPYAVRSTIAAMARPTAGGWHVPLDPAIKRLLGPSGEGADEWALLSAFSGAVGIVRGRYSGVLTGGLVQRMARTPSPPAPVETIEHAGHAVPLEQPLNLAAAVAKLASRLAHAR